MADVEEIIRDLLHPNKDKREKALAEIAKNWHNDFRPYLWKAIENEQDKLLQKSFIIFTINQLGDKSLRKMLRFVENGVLFPSSIREIVKAYAESETDEIREALFKALMRNSPSINEFVAKLFRGRELELMPSSKVLSLLSQIFDSECTYEQKYMFAKAITEHPNTLEPRSYLDQSFRNIFKDNFIIRQAVLDVKGDLERSTSTNSDKWFIWNRIDWEKEEFPILNSLDDYLLNSLKFRDKKLRKSVIKILSNFVIPNYSFIEENQWDAYFDIWNGMIENSIDIDYINLEDYSEENLEMFFGEKLNALYEDMRISEIHPHRLRKLAICLLPLKIMLNMARDDPDNSNRLLCYQGLKSSNFYFENRENGVKLVGSPNHINKILNRTIIAMQHEQSEETKESAYELFEFLISRFLEISENEILSLKNLMTESDYLSKMKNEEDGYWPPARILLRLFINNTVNMDEIGRLNFHSAGTIIRKFISTLEQKESCDFIIELLKTQETNIRKQIIDELHEIFANREVLSSEKREHLEKILDIALTDSSIKIRSYARLLLNKLK
ncbi:MAG: hypothetical protein HeimC2_12110 [Candidatus Heimdallarchaeota archaeon LC_2]|nr:MAG: hypothetical protein HeimC2_12110 [Candidatus Heimdallarchaeota archaeon LC_2]